MAVSGMARSVRIAASKNFFHQNPLTLKKESAELADERTRFGSPLGLLVMSRLCEPRALPGFSIALTV